MVVNVLFSASADALDANYLYGYDFSGYGDIPLLIKSQNKTMVYFWKDVQKILKTGKWGNPHIESNNHLSIGFRDFSWNSTIRIMFVSGEEHKPFYAYGNFILETKLTNNGMASFKIFNLISKCHYEFSFDCSKIESIINGYSLDSWDIFQIREKNTTRNHLILIEKSDVDNKEIKFIPLEHNQIFVFAQEHESHEMVLYFRNDALCRWSSMQLYPDNQILYIPDNKMVNTKAFPRRLKKETIEGFTKKAVYQDLCLCSVSFEDINYENIWLHGTTVIFPKEHFNKLFLTELKNELLKYTSIREIPNFLKIYW